MGPKPVSRSTIRSSPSSANLVVQITRKLVVLGDGACGKVGRGIHLETLCAYPRHHS
jgi:hypothetical protein